MRILKVKLFQRRLRSAYHRAVPWTRGRSRLGTVSTTEINFDLADEIYLMPGDSLASQQLLTSAIFCLGCECSFAYLAGMQRAGLWQSANSALRQSTTASRSAFRKKWSPSNQ